MQNKKNQSAVGQMIQRCHKWRQKRKQYMDLARQTSDEIERERLLQAAEHYGRIVNTEQGKIDSSRDTKEKAAAEKAKLLCSDESAKILTDLQIEITAGYTSVLTCGSLLAKLRESAKRDLKRL